MAYIGSHIPKDKKGVLGSLKAVEGMGANCFQIFASPRIGKLSDKSFEAMKQEAPAVRNYLSDRKYKLYIHLPYTLNTAKDASSEEPYWIDAIYKELFLANGFGAEGCVLHVGKAVKLKPVQALENMYECIKIIIDKMRDEELNTRLFLETAAGQGTELCVTLDELSDFYGRFSEEEKRYLGICVDTAHIWGAGWDMKEPEKLFKEINEKIGLKNVGIVHFNNSRVANGGKVDRHACIDGEDGGMIPSKVLEKIAAECVRIRIPMVLETPKCIFEVPLLWKMATGTSVTARYSPVMAAFAAIDM